MHFGLSVSSIESEKAARVEPGRIYPNLEGESQQTHTSKFRPNPSSIRNQFFPLGLLHHYKAFINCDVSGSVDRKRAFREMADLSRKTLQGRLTSDVTDID